jgi:signal transduction histidine kinase
VNPPEGFATDEAFETLDAQCKLAYREGSLRREAAGAEAAEVLGKAREDLVELLHAAAQTYKDTPPGVRVSASPPEIPLDLDVDGVRTVLRNLLGNAVKYSLPDSRPIELSVTRDSGRLVVRVIDDGPGIPKEDLVSIFDPFFRVDRSRSRKTGGYGLGLSICKRIVEAHGGQIPLCQ